MSVANPAKEIARAADQRLLPDPVITMGSRKRLITQSWQRTAHEAPVRDPGEPLSGGPRRRSVNRPADPRQPASCAYQAIDAIALIVQC